MASSFTTRPIARALATSAAVTSVMPSRCTSAAVTRVWKARLARIARLGGRVEALDVGGRVGLGVAERCRLLQRLGEAGAGGVHPVQDEVGGAVDDAEHARASGRPASDSRSGRSSGMAPATAAS